MNQKVIDLTNDDKESPISKVPQAQLDSDQTSTEIKESFQLKPKIKRANYEWIEIKEGEEDINYIKQFKESSQDEALDFKALDIELLDPDYKEPTNYGASVIDKIEKRIAKQGMLYSQRRNGEDYDYEDYFVDDSANPDQKFMKLNALTPAFEDFVSFSGGIDSFKRSPYHNNRMKAAQELDHDLKHDKKKSAKGKKSSKRKNEEELQRAENELRKVKKITDQEII